MAFFVFYFSLGALFYMFFGYPLFLFLISLFVHKKICKGDIEPNVTLVIPVYNEEKLICSKLNNCLDLVYPDSKMEIVVVSDSSTDRTEEIVSEFDSDKVKLLRLPFRGGKGAAQNYAVRFVQSDIIIFTDVAITVDPDSLKKVVQNFHDKNVGVVSCRDVIIGAESKSAGEKGYINYDMIVRKMISKVGSLIGVTGGFYAVRNEIAQGGWNPAFPPDFYVALRSIKRGLRVVEDSRVKAYYRTAAQEWDELSRKARTINRGMRALFSVSNRSLLNPIKFGIISLELFSHKIMRWLTPFFLIALFFSNFFIYGTSNLSIFLLWSQISIYSLGFVAFLFEKDLVNNIIFRIPFYFVIANTAILKAWYELMTGRSYVKWQPTRR